MIWTYLRALFFFILLMGLWACTTLPGTNDSVFLLTSPTQEAKLGEDAYKEILKKEKESTNAHQKEILLRVGKRIAAVAEARHHVGYQWEFKLIESKQINAFCLPGGKVAVYTGILAPMQNEAALAIVLGHEVAHATLRHGGRRMSQSAITAGLMGILDAGANVFVKNPTYKNAAMGLLGAGSTVLVALPFSRANETEADEYGLEYAAQAGYDPAEAPIFWHRMSAASGGGKGIALLSDHPADAARIRDLESMQPKVQQLYVRSAQYGLGDSL